VPLLRHHQHHHWRYDRLFLIKQRTVRELLVDLRIGNELTFSRSAHLSWWREMRCEKLCERHLSIKPQCSPLTPASCWCCTSHPHPAEFITGSSVRTSSFKSVAFCPFVCFSFKRKVFAKCYPRKNLTNNILTAIVLWCAYNITRFRSPKLCFAPPHFLPPLKIVAGYMIVVWNYNWKQEVEP